MRRTSEYRALRLQMGHRWDLRIALLIQLLPKRWPHRRETTRWLPCEVQGQRHMGQLQSSDIVLILLLSLLNPWCSSTIPCLIANAFRCSTDIWWNNVWRNCCRMRRRSVLNHFICHLRTSSLRTRSSRLSFESCIWSAFRKRLSRVCIMLNAPTSDFISPRGSILPDEILYCDDREL